MQKKIYLLTITSLLIMHAKAFADNYIGYLDSVRTTVEGLASVSDIKTYNSLADIMLPLLGDQNSLIFTNLLGKTGSDEKWALSLGGGYRQIYNTNYILGEHLYLDYNQSANQNHFWQADPGVEYLSLSWDLHFNTYFPVGSPAETTLKYEIDHSQSFFVGQDEYAPIYKEIEGIGPGVDAAVGYMFRNFHRIHATIGGYYFLPPHAANVRGVVGQLEVPVSKVLSILTKDQYDTLKGNELMLGVKLSFDAGKPVDDIHALLKDPVLRNLATINSGSMGEITSARYATGEDEVVKRKD